MRSLAVADCGDAAGHRLAGHPERPERIAAARAALGDLGPGVDLVPVTPEPATDAELLAVHDARLLSYLEELCATGGGAVDADTYATPTSFEEARRVSGAGLATCRALEGGAASMGLVLGRPPGHHARPDQAMGFCLLNHVAVAAAALADAGHRVAVVDWDVHHGNGTQEIFFADDRVLYASTHQWPLYPGTGAASEVGRGAGIGTTVNVPVPAGATGDVLGRAWAEVIGPLVEDFGPEWILVSAGFDAHRRDPLAEVELEDGDFADLARLVGALAPSPGRTVWFVEGGYRLEAIRSALAAGLAAALEAPRLDPGSPGTAPGCGPGAARTTGGPGREWVERAVAERQRALDCR